MDPLCISDSECVSKKGRSESPHGFIHSDPPDHHRSHLPSLCLSQGSSIRLSGELWSLAEENDTYGLQLMSSQLYIYYVKLLPLKY